MSLAWWAAAYSVMRGFREMILTHTGELAVVLDTLLAASETARDGHLVKIVRARRLEVDFTRPLHSQPADISRRCLVPFGNFDHLLCA